MALLVGLIGATAEVKAAAMKAVAIARVKLLHVAAFVDIVKAFSGFLHLTGWLHGGSLCKREVVKRLRGSIVVGSG